MFRLDTFRLSMNRSPGCFAQRRNLKIVSAYPNFHIFRRRACSYHCFFPEIRCYVRISYIYTQILASSYLLVNLLELHPKHSVFKHCMTHTYQLLMQPSTEELNLQKKLGMVSCVIQTHHPPLRSPKVPMKVNP